MYIFKQSCERNTCPFGNVLCFYVQLSTRLNSFFLYLQKCILQVQDGRKLPSTVIALVNSLDGLSQEAMHL